MSLKAKMESIYISSVRSIEIVISLLDGVLVHTRLGSSLLKVSAWEVRVVRRLVYVHYMLVGEGIVTAEGKISGAFIPKVS